MNGLLILAEDTVDVRGDIPRVYVTKENETNGRKSLTYVNIGDILRLETGGIPGMAVTIKRAVQTIKALERNISAIDETINDATARLEEMKQVRQSLLDMKVKMERIVEAGESSQRAGGRIRVGAPGQLALAALNSAGALTVANIKKEIKSANKVDLSHSTIRTALVALARQGRVKQNEDRTWELIPEQNA